MPGGGTKAARAAGRERGGAGQCGGGGDEREDGLDALADEEGGAGSPGRPEAHGVAVDAPERLAGLGDRGLDGKRIGRLKETSRGVAQHYDIELDTNETGERATAVRFTAARSPAPC